MPSHIYNEGRVVGYSAYEIYVRHSLGEDPNRTPATEAEWLASSIACGSSMVLKIPVDNHSGDHFIEVNLPSDSRLAAANTIIGSLFLGDAEVDSAGWAKKITSYGSNLIQNTSTSPSGDTVEPSINVIDNELPSIARQQILNYVKIVDGIVIQPGTWRASSSGTPPKDLSPAINRVPRVRIQLSDKVTTAFYVLLTGFTIRTVLAGISGLDGSTDTNTNIPEDGGFLGPAIFPWANKIVFSVPASYVSYFTDSNYYRKMSTHGDPGSMEVDEKRVYRLPVIDMETTNPQNYYSSHDSDSRVPLDVTGWNKINGDAVLTVYQRSTAFPPALFGTKVIKAGTHDPYIHPLDTVAPGTLKLFNSDDRNASFEKSKSFQSSIPHNYAFYRDTHDFVVRQVDDAAETTENWAELPVALTYVDSIYGALEGSEVIPPYFIEQTNNGEPEDFAAPSTMYTRRMRGKVSDNFRADFGIDPANTRQYNFLRMAMQSINRADIPGKSDIRINRSMYNYITSDPNWKNSYFFILQGGKTFTYNSVNELTLVPVLKPKSDDVVPSNVFDYIYKAYGPKFKIPVVLPTTRTEANRTGSFGQYVGGYWQYDSGNGEGPIHNQSILEYLEDVVGESVVALQDYNRKVPTVNNYTDWRNAYSAITVENFVTAVIDDAVDRNVIPSTVTGQSVLNNGYDFVYTDGSGNSKTVNFQPIASQYRNLTLSQAFEKAKFYDLSSSSTTPVSEKLVFSVNYAYISNLNIKVKQSSSNGMITTDETYTLSTAPASVIDWDDEDSLMVRIDSATAPSDWSTRFRHFFVLSGTSYNKVSGDSAPTWESGKYYRPKYELIEVYYDKSLTLTTTISDENAPKYTAMEWPTQEAQLRYSFSDGPLAATTITGRKQTRSLSVADNSGKIYDMAGDGGVINDTKDGNIHWDDLLNALVNNKAIDILGSNRFKTELYNRIVAGDGIKLEDYDNSGISAKKISTKVNSAKGIDVETAGLYAKVNSAKGMECDTDGLYAKVNSAKGMECDTNGLYANFAPNSRQGVGIKIEVSEDNEIVVTNTMPDYSNGTYELVQDNEYELYLPDNVYKKGATYVATLNGFDISQDCVKFEYCASNDQKTIAIRISFGGSVYAKMADFGNSCKIHEWKDDNGNWQGRLLPDNAIEYQYDGSTEDPYTHTYPNHNGTDEYHGSTYTDVNGPSIPWPLQLTDLNDKVYWGVFAFRHDLHSSIANQKANIINITFEDTLKEKLFIDGDSSKYRFEDTSGATSGIWNVGMSSYLTIPSGTVWDGRGSWSAVCALRANSQFYHSGDVYGSSQFRNSSCDLAVLGFSYSDGYNSQIPISYNCDYLGSDLLNLEVSGIFKYIE